LLLSILQPAVAEAGRSPFNVWPDRVVVGAEGVAVFVSYSQPAEVVGKCDTSPERMVPWFDGSRPTTRPFQLSLYKGGLEIDPPTSESDLAVTEQEAVVLAAAAPCFLPAPGEGFEDSFLRQRIRLQLRWKAGQAQPTAIDFVSPLEGPDTAAREGTIRACLAKVLTGQPSLAGPARERSLRLYILRRAEFDCLAEPPANGRSEVIPLIPRSNPPSPRLEVDQKHQSEAWKRRRSCLEDELKQAWAPVGGISQVFVPVERFTSLSPAFAPGVSQAKKDIGACIKEVDPSSGMVEVQASWEIGPGGRLGVGRLTSEDRLPAAARVCLRRAIARIALPTVPEGSDTFRLHFRVYTRSTPGAEQAEQAAKSRERHVDAVPYALLVTPLPVLPVEPPPPPPLPPPTPAVQTRVGSGRPPPESFGFTPPARAELDAMQRCLDRCVANNHWSEIGSKALLSAVVEVYPWCDEPPESRTVDCVSPTSASSGPSCAKQCLRQALVERRLYLGAHPDDVVQPEPPPLLALVFDGAVGIRWIPQELAKLAVAAQPSIQRCFLEAEREESVPDWVNLRLKFESDGRVASVVGWEGRGSDALIGCLAQVAAAWAAPTPLHAFSAPAQSLMLISLRRDPRAVGLAGWEMGVRREIRFKSLDPLEPSTNARLLAGFKRYTFGLVGLENHASAILQSSLALLPAFLLLRAFRRRSRRAASQSD